MRKIIATLLTVPALIVNADVETIQPHEPREERYLTQAERAQEKEARAQEEAEAQQESEANHITALWGDEQYMTSHQGALHWPTDVTMYGDYVTLEDGSQWAVKSGDWIHTRNWLLKDQVLVAPNDSFFSLYDYLLINQTSGATVQVNLAQKPKLLTGYGRTITGFNDSYDYIYLDDGSVWSISYFDHSAMMRWCINDTVIIGVNNGWDMYSRPNVLINATMNQYLRAKCIE